MKGKNGILGGIVILATVVLIAYIYSGDTKEKNVISQKNTMNPTKSATAQPTSTPESIETPSPKPTESPSLEPTESPSPEPTEAPTAEPTELSSSEPEKTDVFYRNTDFHYKMVIPVDFHVVESEDITGNDVVWGRNYVDKSGASLRIEGGWNDGYTVSSVEEYVNTLDGSVIRGTGGSYCLYRYAIDDVVYMEGYFIHSEVVVFYQFSYDETMYEDRYQNIIDDLENYVKEGKGIVG